LSLPAMPLTDPIWSRILSALIAASFLLHATYYFLQMRVLHVPSPTRFPYWWSILGSVLMNIIPIGLLRDDKRGYAFLFSRFTFLTGLGMCYAAFSRMQSFKAL
jgi:hypothetical protein